MKKQLAVLTLCVFMISIFAGAAVAKNDNKHFGQHNSQNNFNKGHFKHLLDTDDDWAKEDIEEASRKGFVRGYEDGTYQPNKPVTCLETIVILIRTAGLEDEVDAYDLTDEDREILKKIPDWAKAYVAVALQEGIISQDEIKTFNPNQGAKRYQVCIYMQNALERCAISVDDKDFMGNFTDNDLIPLHARNCVRIMARFGVVNGYPDGSFAPMRVVKRNEIARMINNMDKNCMQNSQANILKGTLDEFGFDNDVLVLDVIDDEGEDWALEIYKDDGVDIYYDGKKLEFDEDLEKITRGGSISILFKQDEEPVWIRISSPD